MNRLVISIILIIGASFALYFANVLPDEQKNNRQWIRTQLCFQITRPKLRSKLIRKNVNLTHQGQRREK